MECQDTATGEAVAVLCAANRHPDGSIDFVPFAKLLDDPYRQVNPPNPDGGFFAQEEIWQ
jgi:hypothetical protein